MSQRNLTMMTDLYQLTMMHGHFMRNAKVVPNYLRVKLKRRVKVKK